MFVEEFEQALRAAFGEEGSAAVAASGDNLEGDFGAGGFQLVGELLALLDADQGVGRAVYDEEGRRFCRPR